MSDERDAQNPFDRLGVDPTMTPEQLTERLRRLAQRLPPDERDKVRALWRKLTLKDSERVKWAFLAHPRTDETPAEPIDELRGRVPPLVDRRDPPPLEATVSDTLLAFGCPSAPPETVRPEPGFAWMADEAQSREDP
jgi:hypothetical protein